MREAPGHSTRIGRVALAAVLMASVLTGCGGGQELPVYWDAPDFTLVDQRADTVRTSDLRGAPWVASFVFTSCTGVCPTITQRMAVLRDRLEETGTLGDEVRLVSFSVDPERDTPDVLREYAASYGGSPSADWAFLTGYDGPAARTMIEEGFRLTARAPEGEHRPEAPGGTAGADPSRPGDTGHDGTHHAPVDEADHRGPGGYQIMHSPRLVLVDAEGAVRGTYDATEPGVVDDIVDDLRTLQR